MTWTLTSAKELIDKMDPPTWGGSYANNVSMEQVAKLLELIMALAPDEKEEFEAYWKSGRSK